MKEPTYVEMKILMHRFEDRYMPEPNSGCWLWTGATDTFGYGRLRYGKIFLLTHRLSYRIHCGPIPEGMSVLHSCDIPCCVNPDHLRLGTPSDNTSDMMKRNRWRAGNRARGEHHVSSRLTEQQVLSARSQDRQW